MDVVLASMGLVGLAPLFIFVSAAIIIDSGWPPLYTQERVGRLGRRFRMWKFRTMRRGAHELRSALLSRNEAPFPVFKLHDDPRVTKAGRLLRRSSLDELPQLWNVVRGEMSLVGPRPPLPEEVAEYDARALQRLAVRPGLTCTWQIERRRRDDISFDEWVSMDLAYLEGWRLQADIRLLLRTVGTVVRMTGE
ncbi:MAG TPA: sugar transferase [Candidatus Limnocylindria bacterium]|nr:sugar transferase [Candidatus Limnocylindria bacterium]